MPVVVTGADTPLGRLVIDRLVGAGLDLRATVSLRESVQPLIDRGVKTAVSDLVDTERFGAVVENAHTVIHLRGVNAGTILDGIPDVLAALPDSGVERIVTLSGFGLEAHPSLELLRASGLDVLVLRVGVVLAPLSDAAAARPLVRPGTVRIAPLHVDDLADALIAADHLRDLRGYRQVDAVGRDVITGSELDDLLGVRRRVGIRGLAVRGLAVRGLAVRGLAGRLRGVSPPSASHDTAPEMVGDRGAALVELLRVTPMSVAAAVADITTRP